MAGVAKFNPAAPHPFVEIMVIANLGFAGAQVYLARRGEL